MEKGEPSYDERKHFGNKSKMKDTGAPCENDNDTEEEEDIDCPLFMTSLPKDFSTNSGLAAIASLLEDEEENVESEKEERKPRNEVTSTISGGKVKRKVNSRSRNTPYPSTKQPDKKASLGEAQLFLKMWKL